MTNNKKNFLTINMKGIKLFTILNISNIYLFGNDKNFQPEISGILLKCGEKDYNISICNVELDKTKYTRSELINELIEKIAKNYNTIDNFTTNIEERFNDLKNNSDKDIKEILKNHENLMSLLKNVKLVGYGFTFLDVNKIDNNKIENKDKKKEEKIINNDQIIDFSNYKFLDLWFEYDKDNKDYKDDKDNKDNKDDSQNSKSCCLF